jgi:mono/diheme cytochrome c family protein
MKRFWWFAGATILLGALFFIAIRSNAHPAAGSNARTVAESSAATIERGRYLVQQVALCGDCHTPHNEKGEAVVDQAFQGASTIFKPLQPVPNWAEYTPALAGFPGFTEDQALTFLTTGKDASGQLAAPPMPQYRFSREDAAAVLAYLKSLVPAKK